MLCSLTPLCPRLALGTERGTSLCRAESAACMSATGCSRRRSNVLKVRFEGLNVDFFGNRNPLLVRDVLLYRQDGTACDPDTREDRAGAVTSGVATRT